MGKQGKAVVVGVMVAAMALGGIGTMFGGRPVDPGGPDSRANGGGARSAELPELLPVADEAVTSAFGTELASQLAQLRPEMDFDAVVAGEQMAARSLPAEASLVMRARFVEGVNRGGEPQIIEQIHGLAHAGYKLSYRGTALRDGQPVARFRLIAPEGGVEFHDLLVGVGNRAPVVIDVFSLTSGQWQSKLLAEGFQLIEGGTAELDGLTALGEAYQAGRFEEVLRLYDTLPESTQRYRAVTARRIEAASLAGNVPRYLEILDEHTARFPSDAGAHVRLLDIHIRRQQWTEASAVVEALDESFSDVYWNFTRAEIALGRDEPAAALTFAEDMIEADPTLLAGPDMALVASLALGDHERADRFARSLRDDFNVDLHELASRPRYEDVAELPAFAEAAVAEAAVAEAAVAEAGEPTEPAPPNSL